MAVLTRPAPRVVDRVAPWVAPLFATMLVTFCIGYSYGEPSHVIFLPWVLHHIDPSVLATDWFVNTIPHHFNSIRFMAWLAHFVPLPVGILVIHFIALVLLLAVIYRLVDQLFADRRVFWVALFLLLRWGTDGLGGNGLWGNYLVQHNAAAPVCLLAFYLVLRNQPVWAAVACAAATWIHIQLGALTMLVIGSAMLLDGRAMRLRRVVLAGLIYAAAIAPTAAQQWLLYMSRPSPLSAAEYVYIHAVMRHPHHLIPSSWYGSEFYRFFLLMGIGALAANWREKPHRTVLIWTAIILALCVVGTVFVEWVPVKLITKLQLFRMTIFVKFFAVVYVARFLITVLFGGAAPLGRGWPPGQPAAGLVETAGEPARGPAAAQGGRPTKPKQLLTLGILATRNFAIVGVCAALIVALRQKSIWRWGLWVFAGGWVAGVALIGSTTRNIPMLWHHFGIQSRELWVTAACVAALGIVVWLNARIVPAALIVLLIGMRWWTGLPYFAYDHPPADEWYQFCQQVKAQTPRDAIFITPPFQGGFQLFAERAEVANFKCVPLIETDLVEWKKRLQDLSGTADLRCSGWVDCGSKLAGGYFGLRAPDFRRLARQYRAQYVVTSQPGHRLDFPEQFRVGDFALYRVPGPH